MSLACGALAVSACASVPPPTADVARAEAAIARAQQEQVAVHAPVPLRNAEEKLDSARSAMRDDRNTQARWLAEEATADAQLAISINQKARSQEAVDQLSGTVNVMQRGIQP